MPPDESAFAVKGRAEAAALRTPAGGRRGRSPLKRRVRLGRRYLWPRKTILGFAGWPRRWSRFLAPEIIILKRQDGRKP